MHLKESESDLPSLPQGSLKAIVVCTRNDLKGFFLVNAFLKSIPFIICLKSGKGNKIM